MRSNAHVTAELLVNAYRSLPTIASRLEFLDGHVWPRPASRTAKRMFYRYVALTTRSPQVREWLARREDSRRTPEVKLVLLRSEAKAVLSHILPDHAVVTEAAFPRLLHRLSHRHLHAAASALAQRVHGLGPGDGGESMESNRAGSNRRGVLIWEATLLRFLEAGPQIRQATLDLLPNIEVVS